ncbi:hypothetical protein Q9L58_008129 [Maublancomyces gigas]|uniref:Hyaluronan/mRNA-binding protein domain-containing protein n=1 Tax=Discina gigas TaxID=1032678 RepID=A0ABR3GAX9_9PEZI
MSASVASKNLFDLLGNDIEDPDAPLPPVPREVVKNTATSKKRDEKVTPVAAVTGDYQPRGNRGRGRGGSEGAFRDRDAGRQNNLSKNTEDDNGAPRASRGGRGGRGGGGGGGGGGGRQYDRHSQTGRVDTDKQVGQGWGANKGTNEWDDERAGEELAQKDAAGIENQDPSTAPAETPAAEVETIEEVPEPEPEEIVKTYDEYLAELAQRQADLGPPVEVRRPNEGSSNKKWATAKELSRKEEEEGDYFIGESKDKARNRERKTKQVLDIEPRFVEPREGSRGGSAPRGGRGRGGDRGGRGRGDRDRGDRGGDRGGDRRGGYNGPTRGSGGAVNIADPSAFPSLGK